MRSLTSSKSMASFVNEITAAKRFGEVASSCAMARLARTRTRAASTSEPSRLSDLSQKVPDSTSSTSIASLSSSKSLTSFKKDIFATGRLGDLNSVGFEARACRRRRVTKSPREPIEASSAPNPSLGVNTAANASKICLFRLPIEERSPFVKYTPSKSLNLASVCHRSAKSTPTGSTHPSFFADLEPEQEFRLRGALLLPGMQFTSSTVGAHRSDVRRSMTGEPEDKTRLKKLVQMLKRP
ncbi:hypothetical protein AURDEDRAFT_158164 [Auricularia subglabra TFB-10046 SS5]|nr:hypothetical protein AURDEDRAFT_158164 [Auricularia subglabra TFB-10046 SS5]